MANGLHRPTRLPMSQPSFLERRNRLGLQNWLLIALVAVFAIGFVPRGVRQAILSNTNKAEDWLPASYPESTDLRWFAKHFVSAQFVLVSWDGCTLAESDKINRLGELLRKEQDAQGRPLYKQVLTGPEQIASLTAEPSNLKASSAIARLEGALVGPVKRDAEGNSLGNASRTTCLVAYLSPEMASNNRLMRMAVDRVEHLVQTEFGVEQSQVHMGGPPVDNVTIDKEGEKTLMRLAGLSAVVGISLSFWCFRSLRLTWFVFSVACVSAGVSLAIVYYYGVFEIRALGMDQAHLGTADAILMSMPAVVYVLGLSGAIHIVNYYREERDKHGTLGAVERGVRIGWGPCALAALTTAVGLGSLGASDIIPIKKFGIFTAAGVIATIGVLLSLLPVSLHLFPPELPGDKKKQKATGPNRIERFLHRMGEYITGRPKFTAACCLLLMATFAMGLPRITTSVQLLKLLDEDVDLIHDYAWFEEHLGNLVPMEVVVAIDARQRRDRDELAEAEGDLYRMTMVERMRLVERIGDRLEKLEPIGRSMSAATFGPAESFSERGGTITQQRRATDFVVNKALEEHRGALREYLAREVDKRGDTPADDARELWRVSARVAALDDIDYGEFVKTIRSKVEPVLRVYRFRDELISKLHAEGEQLDGARVAVVFSGEDGADRPAESSDAGLLVSLLKESGSGRSRIAALNAEKLRTAGDKVDRYREVLAGQTAVVTLSLEAAEAVRELEGEGINLVAAGAAGEPTDATSAIHDQFASTYTGIVPLVYKTQRQLLASLRESIGWATVLIACVMVVVLRSPFGGLVSMIPNVFPIVAIFGILGWAAIKVDIGIMMTASVALGVAVDDTIHFLTWFRRGIVQGLDRRGATLLAYDRCALAMTQTTLIAGLGLAVFATSTFTPTQQFGTLMICMLGAALFGDLILLPALLCSPLGRFFAPGVPAVFAAEQPDTVPFAPHMAAVEDEEDGRGRGDGPDPPPDEPQDQSPAAVLTAPVEREEAEPIETPQRMTKVHSDEPMSPGNAALRAKLKKFRRASSETTDETR